MKKSKSPNEWIVVNQKCNNLVKELRRVVFDKKSTIASKKERLLLGILMRQCSNLSAIAVLTKVSVGIGNSVLFKLPIGLLLRNCYMDCLLGLYLGSITEADALEISEVLHIDYAKALFDEFEVYRDKVGGILPFNDEMLESIYTMNLEDNFLWAYEPNKTPDKTEPCGERYLWKARNKKEVRNLISENEVKNELNIKVVFENLQRTPQYSSYAKNLYAYYKYFSQYEHFSESGFGDAIADFSNDNVNFEMALVRLEESISVIQEELKNNE